MTIDLEDLLDAQPPAPQAVRKASIFDALETILDACGKDIPDKVLEQPGTSVLDQSQSDEGWAKFERGSNQSDDTDPYPGSRRPPADSLAYNLHQLRAIGEFAREKRVDAGVAYCDEGEKGEYIKPYADRVAVDDLDPAHSIGAAIFTLAKDHSFMTRIIGQYRVHRNGQEFSGEWTAGKRDPGDTAQQTFFNEIEEEGGVPPEAITMHVIPPFPTLKDGWSNALQEQYTICVDPEKLIGKRLSSNEIVQQQRILGDILLSGLYKTLKTLSLDPDPKLNDPLTEPSLLVSDPKYHKALALDAPLVQYALGSQLYHHIHGGAPWAKDDEHCDMDTLLAGITPGSVQATSEIDLKRVFAGLLEAVSHQDTDQTEQLSAAAKTLQDYLKNGENTTMKFMDTVISTHDGKPTTKKIMDFMRNVPVWPGDEDREVSLAEQSSREHSSSVFTLAERLGPDGAVMQGPDRASLYDVLALKRRRPPTSFEGKVLENIAVLTHGRGDLSHAVIDALNKELGYSFQMSDLKVVDAFADTDPTITDKHVRVIASLRGSVDPGLTNCAEGISVVILPKDCGSPQSEPNHPDDIGICRIPLEDAHKLLTSLQSKYPESYALDGELVGITAGYETAKVEARLMAEKAAADRETDTSAA